MVIFVIITIVIVPFMAQVTVRCSCGNRSQVMQCSENEREYRAIATARLATRLQHADNSGASVDLSHILSEKVTCFYHSFIILGNGDNLLFQPIIILGNGDNLLLPPIIILGNGDNLLLPPIIIPGNGDNLLLPPIIILGNGDNLLLPSLLS